MDCKETREMLGSLIDNEVTDTEREAILSHIAECESCKKEYEELIEIKKSFSKLDIQLKGALAESVMQRIYAEKAPKKKKPFIFRYMGTAAAIIIIVSLFAYSRLVPLNDGVKNTESANDSSAESTNDEFGVNKSDTDGTFNDMPTEAPMAPAEPAEGDLEEASPESDIIPDRNNMHLSTELSPPANEFPAEEPPMKDSPVSSDVTESESPKAESVKGEMKDEIPETEYSAETVIKFKALNSISDTTAIFFVNCDMDTLVPLFEEPTLLAENYFNTNLVYDETLNILTSNSIEINYSSVPKNSEDTILVTDE